MSTSNSTTNLGLGKWAGTDIILPADVNTNMDKIDAAVNTAQTTATSALTKADVVMHTFASDYMTGVSSGRIFVKLEKALGVVSVWGNLTKTAAGAISICNLVTLFGTAYTPARTRGVPTKLGGYSTTLAGGCEIRADGGIRIYSSAASQQVDFLLIYETTGAVYTALS